MVSNLGGRSRPPQGFLSTMVGLSPGLVRSGELSTYRHNIYKLNEFFRTFFGFEQSGRKNNPMLQR